MAYMTDRTGAGRKFGMMMPSLSHRCAKQQHNQRYRKHQSQNPFFIRQV
jgi:hypothetical protein